MQSSQTKDAVPAVAAQASCISRATSAHAAKRAFLAFSAERRVLWPLCGKRCDTLNRRGRRCEGEVALHPNDLVLAPLEWDHRELTVKEATPFPICAGDDLAPKSIQETPRGKWS